MSIINILSAILVGSSSKNKCFYSYVFETNSGKNLLKCLIIVLFVFSSSLVLAEEFSQIHGVIIDEKTGKPVVSAIIFLEPGGRYTESNTTGAFEFNNLTSDSYRIIIRHVGYQQTESAVFKLSPGEIKNFNISLNEEIYTATDAIVITATRGESYSGQLSHPIDVVSAERLENISPLNASEALQNLQGTFIKDYGGLNAIKTLSIRGSSAEQVLVLLDGQRINNPQNGQVDLSTLSLDGLERVEILRGGGSAIYGADAVGGVVNLVSKRKEDSDNIGGSLKLLSGSFNTRSLDANLKLQQEWFTGGIGYTRIKSEGNYMYTDLEKNDQERSNNDISSHNLFSDFIFRLGNSPYGAILKLNYRYYTSERGSPGPLNFASPLARQWDTNQKFQTTVNGKVINPLNNYQVTAFVHRDKYRYENTDTLFAANTIHNSGLYGIETQFKTIFSPSNELTYGLGYRDEWMESNQFTENHQRNTYYIFIQDEASIKTGLFSSPFVILLIPALRYDHYSAFGSQISPKFGSSFIIGSTFQTAIKFNAGWSFRAPTFNELYWPATAWSSGNQNLKPEKGFDWDIGLNLRNPSLLKFVLNLVYFNIRMNDLIQWQSIDFLYMPVNISKSNNKGVEISTSMEPISNLLTLLANYTYLEARDRSDNVETQNKYLVYRPLNSLNLTLNLHWDLITFGYDYRYVGKRYTDTINEEYLDPYRVSDISLRLAKKFNTWQPVVSFQIKNLFDKRYEVIKYQPIPGREYRISVRISYN